MVDLEIDVPNSDESLPVPGELYGSGGRENFGVLLNAVILAINDNRVLSGPRASRGDAEPRPGLLFVPTDVGNWSIGVESSGGPEWLELGNTGPSPTFDSAQVSGDLSVGGTARVDGNEVFHEGNLDPDQAEGEFLPLSGGTLTGLVEINGNFLEHLRFSRSEDSGSWDITPTTGGGGGLVFTRESEDGFSSESRLGFVSRNGEFNLELGDNDEQFYHTGNLDPATSSDLDAQAAALDDHTTDTDNPHGTTAEQVGALPLTGGTLTGPIIWTTGNRPTLFYNSAGSASTANALFEFRDDDLPDSGNENRTGFFGFRNNGGFLGTVPRLNFTDQTSGTEFDVASGDAYVNGSEVVTSLSGSYSIQKDGSDGPGVINFKTS